MNLQPYLYGCHRGREGWIYLIHAIGTSRFKIGRSINPISRYETLRGQSPYPLQIISVVPSLDAITDEAALHEHYSTSRVHGEWFDLSWCEPNSMCGLIDYCRYESTTTKFIRADKNFLLQIFPDLMVEAWSEKLHFLHSRIKNHTDLSVVESLIRKDIPDHIGLTGNAPHAPFPINRRTIWQLKSEELSDDAQRLLPKLEIYIAGIIEGAIMALGGRSSQ